LAAQSNDNLRLDEAEVIAEAHFDLARIRAVRAEVVANSFFESGVADLMAAANALEKVARYEQRTRSKLRKGLKRLRSA
jgi:hypothetical protein